MTSKSGLNEPNELTREESERFSAAFKNPEFKKMFFEYCNELSDPAVREANVRELARMENCSLIAPTAEFCIRAPSLFINICSSPEMKQMSESKVTGGVTFNITAL